MILYFSLLALVRLVSFHALLLLVAGICGEWSVLGGHALPAVMLLLGDFLFLWLKVLTKRKLLVFVQWFAGNGCCIFQDWYLVPLLLRLHAR